MSLFSLYSVILACCVLHNIAPDRNQYLDEDELEDLADDDNDQPLDRHNENLSDSLIRRLGFAKRNRITDNSF